MLHWFLTCYFHDILAGILIVSLTNLLLKQLRLPPLGSFGTVSCFVLLCGLFWEYVTPLYLPRAVSDPWDLLAYWGGGLIYLLLC